MRLWFRTGSDHSAALPVDVAQRSCALSLWKSAGSGLAKLPSRTSRALRDGIQLSKAITGDGAAVDGPRRHRREAHRLHYVSGRTRAWLKTKNPNFQRS